MVSPDLVSLINLDKTKAMQTLASLLNETYPSPSDDRLHVVDVPHAGRMYKTLLQGGHFSHATHGIMTVPGNLFSPMQFSRAWMKGVDHDRTKKLALGGGAFVVASLVERVWKDGDEKERKDIMGWFDEAFLKDLRGSEVKGKKVLLDVLSI